MLQYNCQKERHKSTKERKKEMKRKNVVIGYSVQSVFYDNVLPTCPNGSCGYSISEDGTYILISYVTNVCGYNPNTGEIYCNGTYSATTRKHIGLFAKFLNSLFGTNLSYYTFKECVED